MVRTTNCALSSRSNGEDQEEYLSLLFLVQDTGIGMTPEQASKSFDVFSQVDTSSTRQHEGTGLGVKFLMHIDLKNEYSYHNFIGGQWLDYSGGLIFGYWFNKNLGAFIEGKYNKYWNREWHNFSFGVNYKIF